MFLLLLLLLLLPSAVVVGVDGAKVKLELAAMMERDRMPGREAAVAVDMATVAVLGAVRDVSRSFGFTRLRGCPVERKEDTDKGKFLCIALFLVASSMVSIAIFPARNVEVNPKRGSFEGWPEC